MAKKSNQKKNVSEKQEIAKQEEQEKQKQQQQDDSSSDDDASSEEEGEDLILEGVLVRNPDVESSDDSDDDDDDSDSDDSDSDDSDDDSSSSEEEEEPKHKKAKTNANTNTNTKKPTQKESQTKTKTKATKKKNKKKGKTEIIPCDFTFNDMDAKYFHGIKNHLLTQPAYAGHSSALADIMIENISVGTVVSTADGDDNVFGFASVLNVTAWQNKNCIQKLKQMMLASCPSDHTKELSTVLSGSTKRPAGFLLHGRMVNLPLEITLVLHEQLVKDMDWAVQNAEGGEEERKSLNFGAFVLLASCSRDNTTHSIMYKNFDDEIFAGCAEFVFTISSSDLRKGAGGGARSKDGDNEDDLVNVIVMTKTGHRKGMAELRQMIHG